jgi:divalent metal cation (Fe/Co/Zn/Cd) transporter
VVTPPISGRVEITPDQRAKERSILFAILLDGVMGTALTTVAVFGGSLTMMAEALRGALNYLMECFSFLLMRRVHRGALADMEFGAGKVEQVANALVGSSMLMAAAWIGVGVVRIVTGQRELGSPLGLACAAMFGAVNFYVNLLAWDSVRRAAATGTDSLIMQAQLNLRLVKLWSSLVVGVSLTIAALSTDDVIVAFADGLGSLFVAGYLAVNAIAELRSSIPDLLDRSAGKGVRQVVARALAAHSADYSQVHRSRSRRSGHVTFIEIALGFDMSLSIAEVDRRIEALKQTIRQSLNDAEISIVASSAAPEPLPALAPNS